MEPAHAFPEAVEDPAAEPEVEDPAAESEAEDPAAESDTDGALAAEVEDAAAVVPTAGALLCPLLPELPPAHPVTVKLRQAIAVIPLIQLV